MAGDAAYLFPGDFEALMPDRRVGLWLIGALGGIGSTVALGLAALRRGLTDWTALVTALPLFEVLELDAPADFVLGGHDIRREPLIAGVRSLQQRSRVFDPDVVRACEADLEAWHANLRPGTILNSGETIARLADRTDLPSTDTPRAGIERIQNDLAEFRKQHRLDQVVVVNVASTEPPAPARPEHAGLDLLEKALGRRDGALLPVSSLYAYAAIDLGMAYVNFTPSPGADLPALHELAARRGTVIAGKDGKTGETLLKTVLAPMFARRNLRVLSWVGHNILGNRDGLVLSDPRNKSAKVRSKDQVVSRVVGYEPQTHTSIEYIESLDDWKTAWDHVHFEGFLGVRMTLQFTWQGCDSALAAPLVIDLARLALHARRRGEVGVLPHLACFFKSPTGTDEYDFLRQHEMLEEYVRRDAVVSRPAS
jgi:myo-inositol-1-phosphate synthase